MIQGCKTSMNTEQPILLTVLLHHTLDILCYSVIVLVIFCVAASIAGHSIKVGSKVCFLTHDHTEPASGQVRGKTGLR